MAGGPTPYEAECKTVGDLAKKLVTIIDAAKGSNAQLFNVVKQIENNDPNYPMDLLRVLAERQ